MNRRDFLRSGCAALGAATLAAGLGEFGLVNALAQSTASDYKALVCIFLGGGNDGNNTVVPLDAEYSAYQSVRGAAGLSLPQSSLLPINPTGGRPFGLHPSMADFQTLFNQQKLAVLCNVGPLVEPLTRSTYLNGTGRAPYQLFSHADQIKVWQTAVSDSVGLTGWGGRVAERASPLNGSATFPQVISVAGANLFTISDNTKPLGIAPAPTPLNQVLPLFGGAPGDRVTRRAAFDQLRGFNRDVALVKSYNDTVSLSLQSSEALATPATGTLPAFPATTLGRQLEQIARVIQLRSALGLKRQIFFCGFEGFDTHSNQIIFRSHDLLLQQVSQAMKAFYDATVSMGVQNQVTTFTLSDFGRTLAPSGSGAAVGSDHGWGNHHFILGGAVRGGYFYGRYPTLALGGPDDADDRGRWIPTTSIEQYGATLATWYGVPAGELSLIFPAIGRFATPNLSFMQ